MPRGRPQVLSRSKVPTIAVYEVWREGVSEGGREGGREGGSEGGREGGREGVIVNE